MNKCRICKNTSTEYLVLDDIPMISEPKKYEFKAIKKTLNIYRCEFCDYLYIDNYLDSSYYDDYLYTPQISDDVKRYLDNFSLKVSSKCLYPKDESNGLEIGSGEGSLCLSFKKRAINFEGIEPSECLSKQSKEKGIQTYNSYFDENLTKKLDKTYDFIVIRHVLEHIENLEEFMNNIIQVSHNKTNLIIEVPYLGNILKEFQYYGFFFEHLSYFSLKALNNLLLNYGFYIYDYEFVNPEGGSVLIYANKENNQCKIKDTFIKTDVIEFKKQIVNFRTNFLHQLSKFNNPAIYGAGQRSLTLISMLNLTSSQISCIFDENKNYNGLFTPLGKIPIINSSKIEETINENKIDGIFIFATSYDKEIFTKYFKYKELFYSIIPKIEPTSKKYGV